MPTEAEESIDAFQQYYARPHIMPKKQSFKQMFFNPEEKTVFGRTFSSWKNNINLEKLKSITKEEIKSMFDEQHIGLQIKFEHHIAKGIHTKSRIKYSIKDSQESVMISVETHYEIRTKIQEMKNLCLSNHSKLQPFIVGVREKDKLDNEYVVVLDDIKFKFETFLNALDLCFKLFQVLHISYPKESILVWNFIQRFFYDVQTKYDDDSPVIATLISDLKNAIKINEA